MPNMGCVLDLTKQRLCEIHISPNALNVILCFLLQYLSLAIKSVSDFFKFLFRQPSFPENLLLDRNWAPQT